MPKSRNRKNHKKKVAVWKANNQQKINTANKQVMELQKRMMDEFKKKQEETKDKKETSVEPKTL
tara:strand:- start:12 stop:203 length:192 start_codon:yes stop_codon:yes gene_type:complete